LRIFYVSNCLLISLFKNNNNNNKKKQNNFFLTNIAL
jgi:hypothetical protein